MLDNEGDKRDGDGTGTEKKRKLVEMENEQKHGLVNERKK